jgi:hypothetical protein
LKEIAAVAKAAAATAGPSPSLALFTQYVAAGFGEPRAWMADIPAHTGGVEPHLGILAAHA